MMKNVKSLLLVCCVLLIMIFAAACGENEPQQDVVPPPEISGEVEEVTLYLHGIANELDEDDEAVAAIIDALELIVTSAHTHTASDTTDMTTEEMTARFICLELTYEEPESSIIYAIRTHADGKSTLIIDGVPRYEIAEAECAQLIADQAMELQQPDITHKMAEAANMQVPYLENVSDDIEDEILGPIIYNTLAFYQNCHNYAFAANANLLTPEFDQMIQKYAAGEDIADDKGAQIVLQLTNYLDYDATPASLQVVEDGYYGDYIAYLTIDEINTLQIVFVVLEGYPYIDACYLMAV